MNGIQFDERNIKMFEPSNKSFPMKIYTRISSQNVMQNLRKKNHENSYQPIYSTNSFPT